MTVLENKIDAFLLEEIKSPCLPPQHFPSPFPHRSIFWWAPLASPTGPAATQNWGKDYVYSLSPLTGWPWIRNWVTCHLHRQPWGRHGPWAVTCVSTTSGFPPPFCGLTLRSWASALAPPFLILCIVFFILPNCPGSQVLTWMTLSSLFPEHSMGSGRGCTGH